MSIEHAKPDENKIVGHYPQPPPDDRFLRIPEVCRLTGYSRASLYRLERKGDLPARIKLAANGATAWRLSDIRRWMASRMEAGA